MSLIVRSIVAFCFTEALELLSNPQSEGGLTQAIVDAMFSRKTSDIDEFTYDTDTAVKANNIGADKRSPTPSEGLIRGERPTFSVFVFYIHTTSSLMLL